MELNTSTQTDLLKDDLSLTTTAIDALKSTAKWAKFIAIVGFVAIGLMILASFFIGSIFAAMPNSQLPVGFPTTVLTVFYIIIALIYFFPILNTYLFASRTLRAIKESDELTLEAAFKKLKSVYAFAGILILILLSIYALLGLGGLIVSLAN